MARTWRTPGVAALVAAAVVFVPLFAGLVESPERGTRPRLVLPPLVEDMDASEPELRPAIVLPLDEPEEAPAPARTSAGAPAPFARLTGIVLRPEGEPAAGARVRLGQHEVRCASDGRFALELDAPAPRADLVAHEPGFEPALHPCFGAELTRGNTSEARLVLGPPTLTLTGRVLDRAGAALGGWHVELDGLDPLAAVGLREPTLTDAEGRFVLPDVPAGAHVLRAFESEGGPEVRSAPVDAGRTDVTLVVDRAQ